MGVTFSGILLHSGWKRLTSAFKRDMFSGELIPPTVPEVRRLRCQSLWLACGRPTLTIQ